jgi:hypothetical protein
MVILGADPRYSEVLTAPLACQQAEFQEQKHRAIGVPFTLVTGGMPRSLTAMPPPAQRLSVGRITAICKLVVRWEVGHRIAATMIRNMHGTILTVSVSSDSARSGQPYKFVSSQRRPPEP